MAERDRAFLRVTPPDIEELSKLNVLFTAHVWCTLRTKAKRIDFRLLEISNIQRFRAETYASNPGGNPNNYPDQVRF